MLTRFFKSINNNNIIIFLYFAKHKAHKVQEYQYKQLLILYQFHNL